MNQDQGLGLPILLEASVGRVSGISNFSSLISIMGLHRVGRGGLLFCFLCCRVSGRGGFRSGSWTNPSGVVPLEERYLTIESVTLLGSTITASSASAG
jgi:hypothetical protein